MALEKQVLRRIFEPGGEKMEKNCIGLSKNFVN
jgi:hypothetical protein